MKPFDGYVDQNSIPRIVAKILNGGPNSKLPSHAGTWLLEDPARKKGNYGEAMQQAKTMLRSTLRQLVDQWVNSGRGFTPEGIDIPKERSLFKRPRENFALEKYISEWLGRNRPTIGMLSGHIGVPGGLPDQPPMYLQFNPPGLDERLPPEHGGTLWGQELAGYYLIRLISSPAQRRFARCSEAGCGRYFVYKRAPEKRYKTCCPRHKNAGAKRRVYASRKQQHSRRIEAAARYWSKWRKGASRERSEWVAAMANNKLNDCDKITRRFVTTYSAEIEKFSKGENHAEG